MPEEIDVSSILIEEVNGDVLDMSAFDDTVQDDNMCIVMAGDDEITVERRFTYRGEGNELDEDCFSNDEMIEFAKEHEFGFIMSSWQSCSDDIVYSEYSDEFMEQREAVYGYINGQDLGYFHHTEDYVRVGDEAYADTDIANEHEIYYNDCCDAYCHMDDHNCGNDDDDDCYFDNIVSSHKSDSLDTQKRYGTNSPTYSITNGMRYTFGVEIETSRGNLYERDYFNLKSVYDGSTSGPEYVTGVLKGDYGFNHLKDICEAVAEDHEINKRCGIHVHVGGVFNRLFTIMLLRLGHQLQDDIYRMMPPSRLGNTFCKYIPDYVLDITLSNWREHLGNYIHGTGNTLDKHCNKKSRLGSYPSTRYRWINCVNFSSNSGKPTVEFRNHGASMSYDKIRNWTLICMAIVRYAENNQKRIFYNLSEITLEEVIKTSLGDNIGEQIMKYYEKRVALFAHNYTEGGTYYDKLPSGYRRNSETID